VARREVRGGRSQWAESTTASSVNFAASINWWLQAALRVASPPWFAAGGLRGQGGRRDPTEGMVAIPVRIFY
jgi:hypothetical protein